MNVQLETLPNCITKLRVEVPAEKATPARDAIVRDFARHAQLPGFRPGKAPRAAIETKFKAEIQEELQKRLVSDACREAITENKLKVLQIADVEGIEFAPDQSLRFTATVVTSPVFELPEYKGIPIEIPSAEVTDADVDAAIERMRDQLSDFVDVTDRNLEMNDFAVVTYHGSQDGKPLEEVPPQAKMLAHNHDFWIQLTAETFLPGFSEALVGMAKDETREFDLSVPAEFPVAELAGKTVHYSVTLGGIKAKKLPELDDAFATKITPGKTLAELRDIVKDELTRQKEMEQQSAKREAVMKTLLDKLNFELPETLVANETRRLMGRIITENRNRGIADETIVQNHQAIHDSATGVAHERIKGTFVLIRIAEEEKIAVTHEDVEQRLAIMALQERMPLDKLRKELEKRDALDSINEEILTNKVLEFLVANASVEIKASAA